MGKISDIWVRLGLKKEEFDKGMDDAAKQSEGFGAKLGKMKAGALAVWGAIGAAVTKFAQDLIASTNRMGDAWAVFTSQSRAAWDTFLSAISSWDFTNFFGRMREATAEAAEFAKALDTEFEVGNSIRLQRAAMAKELAALKVQMQDATKTFDERIQAAKDYIAKVSPIYDQIEAQAKRMEDAHLGKWLAGAGLGDDATVRADLRKFIVALGENTDMYGQLEQYSKAQRTIDKGVNALGSNYGKVNQAYADRAAVAAVIAEMQKDYSTDLVAMFRAYNDMRGDKDTAPLVEAMIAAGQAGALRDQETQEMQSVMNGLIQQKASAAAAEAAKKAMEDAKAISLDSVRDDIIEGIGEIDLTDIQVEPIKWDEVLGDYDAELDAFVDKWRETQAQVAELNGMLEDAIIASMSNGLQAITDLMFGLEGADASQVLAGILSPFADTMIQLGEMLLAEGLAIKAFKESLSSLNPYVAIGAGVALLAVGSALRSGIQKLGSAGSGATATSTYSGGSSYGGDVQNIQTEMTIYVKGTLKGSDIVLSGQKTLNNWSR